MTGTKHDDGKPRMWLMYSGFAPALVEVAKVATFGAGKYGDYNWRQVENGVDRYTSAMLRHLAAETVEKRDQETRLLHAAHVAWNALARLTLMLDTQPQRGKAMICNRADVCGVSPDECSAVQPHYPCAHEPFMCDEVGKLVVCEEAKP